MVRLTVAITARAQGDREMMDALRFILVGTRLEPGCVECSAWVDPDATVHYVEGWATEDDLRRHVRSDRFTSLLGVLEAAAEPPRVQFDFINSTRGLDYVAEIRHDVLN